MTTITKLDVKNNVKIEMNYKNKHKSKERQ